MTTDNQGPPAKASVPKQYLRVEELPPRPDPVTGLPAPPRTKWTRDKPAPSEQDPDREHDPALAPDPPPGQGPVLFWFRSSRRRARNAAITMGVMFFLVFSIAGGGVGWVTGWGWWAFIATAMLFIYYGYWGERFSAGAEWMADNAGWIRTYDLVSVKAHPSRSGTYLTMRDTGGRSLSYDLHDIGIDHRIWDYAYNGILYSVIAGGAETNKLLHQLGVPRPYPQLGQT